MTHFWPLYYSIIFVINWVTVYFWMCFLVLFSDPFVSLSMHVPVAHCLNFYCFIIHLAIWYFMSSSFVFFFKTALAVLGSFHFYLSFRINLIVSLEKLLILLFWLPWIYRIIWKNWHVYSIKFSNPTWFTSLYIS